MNSKRILSLDLMRGCAVLLMTTLHVGSYYRLDRPTFFSWDYLRFIVPLFVFCSSYVEFSKPTQSIGYSRIISRLKRLLVPYWIFVIVLFTINSALGRGFDGMDFIKHLLLLRVDTIDFDWLVSLFVAFAFILPIIHRFKIYPVFYILFSTLPLIASIFLLFFKTPLPFRLIMWIPWLWIVFEVDLFLKLRSKKWIVPVMIGVSVALFIISRSLLVAQSNSVQLFASKYPPNLYYLSYGSAWMFGVYAFLEAHGAKLPTICTRFLTFLSTKSYSFYLIHIFFLFGMNRFRAQFPIPVLLAIVFVVGGTSCAQIVIDGGLGLLRTWWRKHSQLSQV